MEKAIDERIAWVDCLVSSDRKFLLTLKFDDAALGAMVRCFGVQRVANRGNRDQSYMNW